MVYKSISTLIAETLRDLGCVSESSWGFNEKRLEKSSKSGVGS